MNTAHPMNCVLKLGILSSFVLVSACASGPASKSTPGSCEYPITEMTYKDDTISVQAAVNLAYSAYLKACVDRSVDFLNQASMQYCIDKARAHVKNNVIFILDQGNVPAAPAPKKPTTASPNVKHGTS